MAYCLICGSVLVLYIPGWPRGRAAAWKLEMDEDTYRALNLDIRMDQKDPTSGMRNLNTGEELSFADPTGEDAKYEPAPECVARGQGVAKGRLIEHLSWQGGAVYPETTRDWWVYVPQQYDPSVPAALLVCQDGALPGAERGTVCLDNLIAAGTIPVTIAVLVAPGSQTQEDGSQRSLEYDTVSARYTDFLANDLLPLVEAEFNITKDPAMRCATGGSSGGICAFSCAFFRPDLFGKAISWIGSFTNIRGGHNYPWLVRNTPRKPIAIYLQDGTNDLNNQHGSWPLGNREMQSALSYAGYTFHMEWGSGCHSGRHMAALLPEALTWIFATDAAHASAAGGDGAVAAKL